MTGRPSTFTEEVADAICERIVNGESVRAICRDEGTPSMVTVFKWLRDFPSFAKQYALAKEMQAEALADEIIEIADDGTNDWMMVNRGDNEAWVTNGEALQRSRLRVDARKWAASKLLPKKYGDRLVHAGDKEEPMQHVVAVNPTQHLLTVLNAIADRRGEE